MVDGCSPRGGGSRGARTGSSARGCRPASSPTTSTGCGRVEALRDIHHRRIAHPEARRERSASSWTCSGWRSSLAPRPVRVPARLGPSTSCTALKLTEAATSGIGHMALRHDFSPPEALEDPSPPPRSTSVRFGATATMATGRPTAAPTPTATRSSCSGKARSIRAARAPHTLSGAISRSATRAAVSRSSGSTTSTCSRATSRALPRVRHRRPRLPPLRGHRARRRALETGAWLPA